MKWTTHTVARRAPARLNQATAGQDRGASQAHTLSLPATPRPRNPLVAAAHQRHAGAHGPDTGARRQRERQALRTELARSLARCWPDGDT